MNNGAYIYCTNKNYNYYYEKPVIPFKVRVLENEISL